MKAKETYSIVMIPTDNPSWLFFCDVPIHQDKLIISQEETPRDKDEFFRPQHLYIVSNKTIEAGGFHISDELEKRVYRSLGGFNKKGQREHGSPIIASTDESITPNSLIHISRSKWISEYYNATKTFPEIISESIPYCILRKDGCPFCLDENGNYNAQDEHGIESLLLTEAVSTQSSIIRTNNNQSIFIKNG